MSLTKVSYSLITGAPLNVKDFGAVGDGVANDTAAIQAAINAGQNRQVVFPSGTYLVSTQISIISNIKIVGQGKESTTITANATINSIFYLENDSNVEITGIKFNGNNNTLSNIRAYASSTASNVTIQNCSFTGTKNDATLNFACIEFSLTIAGARYSYVNISDNTFDTCGTHGAVIAYVDKLIFSRNFMKDIGQHGMEAVSCSDVVISDNIAINCGTVGPGGSGLGVGARTVYWNISNNVISDCRGDAPITCEFTSNFGVIDGNVVTFSNAAAGISVAFGSVPPNNAPFDKLQNVVVSNNVVINNSGGPFALTGIGINVYSTTAALGSGVIVSNNNVNGFNVGIAYAYLRDGQIANNNIIDLTGTSSAAIKATYVTSVDITNNSCNTNSGDHSYQILDFAGLPSGRCNVVGNFCAGSNSGAKALIYIEGNDQFQVSGNSTTGSLHAVLTSGTPIITVSDNTGNIVSTVYAGTGSFSSQLGSATATTVGAAGGASALPATPLGYVTVSIPNVGPVKIPYYTP
jgi:hypothetical protein